MAHAMSYLFFWNYKRPIDNQWHPVPGASPLRDASNVPTWYQKVDLSAAVVDAAPFVAGAGGLAHMSQLNQLGWTVPASVFRNVRTMRAMNRTALFLTPVILVAQAAELDYRYAIPRWASAMEHRRGDEEARQHVDVGMYCGLGIMILRSTFGWAKASLGRFSVVEMVMAGALADLAHREYCKAHGL